MRMLKMIENILKTAIGKKERKKESMERMSIVGDSIIEVPGLHF